MCDTEMNIYSQIFGYIFSDDTAVVLLVSKVMPLVASFQACGFLHLRTKPQGHTRSHDNASPYRLRMDWQARAGEFSEDRVSGGLVRG